jgi:hypothetical protein
VKNKDVISAPIKFLNEQESLSWPSRRPSRRPVKKARQEGPSRRPSTSSDKLLLLLSFPIVFYVEELREMIAANHPLQRGSVWEHPWQPETESADIPAPGDQGLTTLTAYAQQVQSRV